MHAATCALFDIAVASLRRTAEHPSLVALVERYADRYVRPGRTPADDPILEAQ